MRYLKNGCSYRCDSEIERLNVDCFQTVIQLCFYMRASSKHTE